MSEGNPRNTLLSLLAEALDMPIKDMLSLTFGHCTTSHLSFKSRTSSIERKFRLPRDIKYVAQRLLFYYLGKGCQVTEDTPLFLSQKGYSKPISKWQAYRILKKTADDVDKNHLSNDPDEKRLRLAGLHNNRLQWRNLTICRPVL
jgi:hypothetical protein